MRQLSCFMLLCYIPQVWAECVDLGHIIFGLAVPQALRCAPLQEAYPRNEAKKLKRLTTAPVSYTHLTLPTIYSV